MIASIAVDSAIDYDEYCGGEAEMIVVKNSGEVKEICDSVLYPGYFAKLLQQETWKLLHKLAHLKGSKETQSAFALDDYYEEIRKAHDSQKWSYKMFEDDKESG